MNTLVGERAVYIYSSQVLIFSVCTTAARQHHIENISSPRLFKAKVKKNKQKTLSLHRFGFLWRLFLQYFIHKYSTTLLQKMF